MAEIDLVNKKGVFPSMSLCFQLQSEMVAREGMVYLRNALYPGESTKLKWEITPLKRGQFELWLTGVQSKFPFGFLQKTVGSYQHTDVLVWPARVAYLFSASDGYQQMFTGAAKNKPGQGSDLLNIRPYEHGDAPRFIHWKATARTGQLMIRQLAQEGQGGYHLYVDSDAAQWRGAQFELLCSLVFSLAEDLFHHERLETVQLNDSVPLTIRTKQDLHLLFDQLSLLERQEQRAGALVNQRKNQLTFGPMAEEGVAIYLEGNYAGQTDIK